MNNYDISREYGDGMFRIHSLFWLALCNDGMVLPDALDDIDERSWPQAFGFPMPDYVESNEAMAQELIDRQLFGFLARVDVQIPKAKHASGYSTFGWGNYWQRWIYAESIEEVLEKAKQVSKSCIDGRLAELAKEPT